MEMEMEKKKKLCQQSATWNAHFHLHSAGYINLRAGTMHTQKRVTKSIDFWYLTIRIALVKIRI